MAATGTTSSSTLTPSYLNQIGSPGSGNGQLTYPLYLAIASNGNVYVADSSGGRIQVFHSPQDLGTVTSATGSSQINLTLPGTSDISSITSSVASATDSSYDYPLGLVNFTASVTSGSTVPVTLTFQTDLKPSDVTARKYNPTTKEYSDIAGAIITETAVSGQPALQLTYSVTDGGTLD
ncbi:MAG: choice-of-anchor U domain-containing protein [Candidatus Saccharimonadales bacterium]